MRPFPVVSVFVFPQSGQPGPVQTIQPASMDIWQYEAAALSRRHSQVPMLRPHPQGDTVRRPSQAALTQSKILKRSNKKYSVANAAAAIGVKTALLVGKLGIIIFIIYFLF